MKYNIMLKNDVIASIESATGEASVLQVNSLPFILYEGNYFSAHIYNLLYFNKWCASRLLPLDTYDPAIVKKFLLLDTIYEKTKIALTRNCISDSDSYWVREDNWQCKKVITWDDVKSMKS